MMSTNFIDLVSSKTDIRRLCVPTWIQTDIVAKLLEESESESELEWQSESQSESEVDTNSDTSFDYGKQSYYSSSDSEDYKTRRRCSR